MPRPGTKQEQTPPKNSGDVSIGDEPVEPNIFDDIKLVDDEEANNTNTDENITQKEIVIVSSTPSRGGLDQLNKELDAGISRIEQHSTVNAEDQSLANIHQMMLSPST